MEASRTASGRPGIKGGGQTFTLAFALDPCGFERVDTLMHEEEKLFKKLGAGLR